MSKSASSSFPLELTTEILLRLPPESVVRSRYVSKLWSSITTDPYFTNKFETRSSTRPSLLMFFKNKDKLFVFSFPHHNQNSNEPRSFSQHVDCYHMKYPKDCSFPFAESVHGLICFRTSVNRPIIWNPSIRHFIKLTKPGKKWKDIKVFLGYDPIEGKHKVVCMRRGKDSGEYCRVLTLGSAQQSWRTVKTNHKHFAYIDCYARCINGVLYYEALLDDDSDVSIIMSFDVRTEKFDMIKLPLHDFWGMMISYEGRLAYLDYYNPMDNGGIKLWILEDKEKHRWSCKHFVTPFGPRLETSYKIDGVTDAGEFILVPLTFLKSFFILYFDPVRNSLRRVEFKGIADDNFRFRNGLGNKRLRALYTIPNHVESLVSF